MWAVGCVAYILAFQTNPFNVNSDAKSEADEFKRRILSNLSQRRNELLRSTFDRLVD